METAWGALTVAVEAGMALGALLVMGVWVEEWWHVRRGSTPPGG